MGRLMEFNAGGKMSRNQRVRQPARRQATLGLSIDNNLLTARVPERVEGNDE